MKYIDKDIKDFDDYIEFTTFNKFNVKILFTKKHYGSVPEKSREEVAEDFSLKDFFNEKSLMAIAKFLSLLSKVFAAPAK